MTTTDDAACIPHVKGGLDLWFPVNGDSWRDSQARVREAIAICHACPVQQACAEAGKDEDDGIWGGLTPEQRQGPSGACRDRKGTVAGHNRHRRIGERPCQHCRTAWSAYKRSLKDRDRPPLSDEFQCGHPTTPDNVTSDGKNKPRRCRTCMQEKRKRRYAKAKCGTTAGYHRHTRERTTVCDPCRQAIRVYNEQRRERLRAEREALK